jgi:hypothetical protein
MARPWREDNNADGIIVVGKMIIFIDKRFLQWQAAP